MDGVSNDFPVANQYKYIRYVSITKHPYHSGGIRIQCRIVSDVFVRVYDAVILIKLESYRQGIRCNELAHVGIEVAPTRVYEPTAACSLSPGVSPGGCHLLEVHGPIPEDVIAIN